MTTNAPHFANWGPLWAVQAEQQSAAISSRDGRIAAGKKIAGALMADIAAGKFDIVTTAYTPTLAEFAASRGEALADYSRDEVEAVMGRIVHGMSSSRATKNAVGKVNGCAQRVSEGKAHNARIGAEYAQAKRDGKVQAVEVREPMQLNLTRHRANIRRLLRRARAKAKREAAARLAS